MLYGFTLQRKTIHLHQDKGLRGQRGPAGRLQIQAETQWCPDSGNKQELPLSTGDWAGPGSEETF